MASETLANFVAGRGNLIQGVTHRDVVNRVKECVRKLRSRGAGKGKEAHKNKKQAGKGNGTKKDLKGRPPTAHAPTERQPPVVKRRRRYGLPSNVDDHKHLDGKVATC